MKKVFKKYVWLFEWMAAAIIIAVGTVIGFVNDVVLAATGIALILIALLRIIPFLKTTRDKVMKWIVTVEIFLNIGVGILLVYFVFGKKEVDIKEVYGYLLGSILYLRAIIYFFETSVKKLSTDITKFIAHIIFITVGTYIIAIKGMEAKTLGYIIFAIAILVSLYIIIDGIKNYNNYRREYAAEEAVKKIDLNKEEKSFPMNDKIKDVVIPEEENKKDEAIVQ